MKFLVDRCAGTRLAHWLREQGHDVVESRERGADPGDREILRSAADEERILITIDTDFGDIIFTEDTRHCGLLRLPDVPARDRIALLGDVLARHSDDLKRMAIITVRSGRIRVSRAPVRSASPGLP